MGDPRKLKAKAETPRKVWDAERIKNDTTLRREYGLRKTRELWSTVEELKRVRRSARILLSMGEAGRDKAQQVIVKLQRLGISKGDMKLEDVLGLTVRDFLERRLQTLVVKKGLAHTMPQARQLITHGFISVTGRRVTIPSYVVTAQEEPTVSYSRAIDISHPEVEKSGSTSARAGREAAAIKAATDAETAAAPQAPAATPAASA
jgi:small subunit ribosomal protein S4